MSNNLTKQIWVFRYFKHESCPTRSYYTQQCWEFMMTSSNGNIFPLLALCQGNSPLNREFPSQRPVMWSCDVFFDLGLYKRMNKHLRRPWFETPSHHVWCHCIVLILFFDLITAFRVDPMAGNSVWQRLAAIHLEKFAVQSTAFLSFIHWFKNAWKLTELSCSSFDIRLWLIWVNIFIICLA